MLVTFPPTGMPVAKWLRTVHPGHLLKFRATSGTHGTTLIKQILDWTVCCVLLATTNQVALQSLFDPSISVKFSVIWMLLWDREEWGGRERNGDSE